MQSLVCVGECMIELNQSGQGDMPVGTSEMSRTFGGDVLNTAVYAARAAAGKYRVSFATGLGTDPYSDDMIAAWRNEDLDTDLVLRFPDKLPGLYMIRTDDAGERTFAYWRDLSPAKEIFRHPDRENFENRLLNADLLYFSGISLAILDDEGRVALLSIAQGVRDRGGHVAFDTNYRPRLWTGDVSAIEWMEKAVRLSTICLPSLEDTKPLMLGETADTVVERLRSLGVEEVVVKDGPGPTHVSMTGQPTVLVSNDVVDKPLDTTAAGDSFNGAYLSARLHGAPPEDAAREGRQQAAWVVQHKGAIVPARPGNR